MNAYIVYDNCHDESLCVTDSKESAFDAIRAFCKEWQFSEKTIKEIIDQMNNDEYYEDTMFSIKVIPVFRKEN